MSEADLATEGGESAGGAPQPEPNGLREAGRWLLALGVALAPLIAIAVFRAPLDLPDAFVGAGVMLSVVLVVGVAVTGLWRARSNGAERHAGNDSAGTIPTMPYHVAMPPTPGPADALTGLPTFHPFSQRLLAEFRLSKEAAEPLAVVLVDINHLTDINKQFGPEAGDQVLRHVTACLQLSKRANDVLARMGDDEFGLLLLNSDAAGARAFVERVQEWLAREPITVRRGSRSESVWIGICAGVSVGDASAADADEVLTAAVDDLNVAREERDRRRMRWKRSA